MYNLASKILSVFLDPLALAIILLVCAFLVRKRRPRVFEITFAVSVVFLLFAGCPTVENWLTACLSINTRENALFSHQLLAARGISHIILVTSAIHMPRAAAAYRKAGFDVVAAPADFQTGWKAPSAIFRWMPQTDAIENSSKAIHEWLGLWVYRFRGWA